MRKGKDSKPHIGIYGRRNTGKSSIINILAGQEIAIVSETSGTTTDPVKKSLEITGFGPVIIIDTAGIDDSGELGEKRTGKTLDSLKLTDLAILVTSHNNFGSYEKELVKKFKTLGLPYFVIHNKSDMEPLKVSKKNEITNITESAVIDFSAKEQLNGDEIIDLVKKTIPESSWKTPSLLGDLLSAGDMVLLITPIDVQAPAGRLILPQVQAIRDIIDNNCIAVVVKESEIKDFLGKTKTMPALAVTDSQVFDIAASSVPDNIPLTSFSIMLARFKGNFEKYLEGTPRLSNLKTGERVLILESCTHHVSCEDIGRFKIPGWIKKNTGAELKFDVVAGLDKLPRKITDYSIVIQCGGCVITRKQLLNRLQPAIDAGVPVTNYGMAIAWLKGVYKRAVTPFLKK